jgi:hypothetical protein
MFQFAEGGAVCRESNTDHDVGFLPDFMLPESEELAEASLESVSGDGVAYSLRGGDSNTGREAIPTFLCVYS